jgi:phosphatidylserine/phosphatidylglycerophosphate/cardiolipin synthase-like enzyme
MPGPQRAAVQADTGIDRGRPTKRWRLRRWLLLAFLVAWIATALWHTLKPMPPGTHVATRWHDVPLADIRLLADRTVADATGAPVIRQEIFDAVFRIIDQAEQVIVLDFFLVNDHRGSLATEQAVHRRLSDELRRHLVARKQAQPGLRILFVTDPINDVYDGAPSPLFAELSARGIEVVRTDLDRLRDSNWVYSPAWRLLVSWWAGSGAGPGWLPNPLEGGPSRVTLRSWLELFNFKANHRKLIAADDGRGGWIGLVTSANPHDASSAHSNLALEFRGELAREIMLSEMDIARFSGWQGEWQLPPAAPRTLPAVPSARLQFLTEGAIHAALVTALRTAANGERVSLATFYLSDREIVDELVAASARGVRVRLILDPNRDAFGRTKDGVPNRPVAAELRRRSGGRIEVRWYRTHGEQFHTKFALVQRADMVWALVGSANFTRRNLRDLNLEAGVALEADRSTPLAEALSMYYEALWRNDPAAVLEYTTDFPTFEDQSFARYWRYRLMEATGLSTF